MNEQEHRERHIELHKSLDELLADFISHTEVLSSKATISELVEWSYLQTVSPTPEPEIETNIETKGEAE